MSKSYPWSSYGDYYHCFVMVVLLLISFVKIYLISQDHMFLTVMTYQGSLIFDTLDVMVHSPRYVALLTISLLHKCIYKGDVTSIHAV
jgi:hypothetical protein